MTSTKPNIWFLALIGGVIGAIINSLIALIFPSLTGQALSVPNPSTNVLENLPLFAVIAASIVPSFAGAGVLLLLRRFVANGTAVFQGVSAVVAVLSCLPAFGMPITTEVKIVLSIMHLVAAAAIVLTLTRPQKA
jgi:hypothetical protein